MNLCEDCQLNNCDECYESDCDCNLADHTIAPALLIKQAFEFCDFGGIEVGDVNPGNLTDSKSSVNLLINGRTYHVTVRS